jgi:hypothetical protein
MGFVTAMEAHLLVGVRLDVRGFLKLRITEPIEQVEWGVEGAFEPAGSQGQRGVAAEFDCDRLRR